MLNVFNHYAITFVPKVFINIVLIKFAIIHLCFDNVFFFNENLFESSAYKLIYKCLQ